MFFSAIYFEGCRACYRFLQRACVCVFFKDANIIKTQRFRYESLRYLTHLSRMEFPIVINWTSPFIRIRIDLFVSKQWRP